MIGLERVLPLHGPRAAALLLACIDAVSESAGSDKGSDSEPEDAAATLRMPDRICGPAAVAATFCTMLNIAEYNGLATLRDEDPDNDPSAGRRFSSITPKRAACGCPTPRWSRPLGGGAAPAELAERAEPWVRDRRRRIDRADGVLLDAEAVGDAVGDRGGGGARRSAARGGGGAAGRGRARAGDALLAVVAAAQHELCTAARVRTALRWAGTRRWPRSAAASARWRRARSSVEPYANLSRGAAAAAGGRTRWASTRGCRALSLFGEEEPGKQRG